MARPFVLIRSFRAKVTAVLVLFMCLSAAVTNLVIYQYSLSSQFDQLRERLMTIARAAAINVDPDTLLQIPLARDGATSQAYKSVEKSLARIKDIAPEAAYAYILKRGDRMKLLKFIIDVPFNSYKAKTAPAYPGENYDGSIYPEMLMAFIVPSADTKIMTDKWGAFLSGYAPIYNKNGDAIAILGVDVSANDIYHIQKALRARAIIILIGGIIFSALLSLVISNTVTSPIKRLVAGTRHIASGDLRYRVKVENPDEIGELAESFNKMGLNLYKARQTLVGYFYNIAESLIRILEAKDPYTKGHSDRVAEYSDRIAEAMKLPKERTKLLHEAALLHDIGKLGLQDMLLYKKAVLTDEDWATIKKHPKMGEEMLKPVSIDDELLSVVREHHERYDGKGYPDGLKGDQIDVLAAIVSAADAYDAMISNRPYRKNLTKIEAMEQLKTNSGLQFNPKIVEAFIKVLEAEK